MYDVNSFTWDDAITKIEELQYELEDKQDRIDGLRKQLGYIAETGGRYIERPGEGVGKPDVRHLILVAENAVKADDEEPES